MPYYRFQIDTRFPPEVVLLRLRELIREQPGFFASIKESFGGRSMNLPPFIGIIDGTSFEMRRTISYRNSFIPTICGQVLTTSFGSRVVVVMRMHAFVLSFLVLWITGVTVAGISSMVTHNENLPLSTPIFMILVALAASLGGFYIEAVKARRILERGVAGAGV